MRKIGFTSCNKKTKEILPSSFKIKMQEQKRRMFICMLNEFLHVETRIKTDNILLYKNDLRYIFTDKVLSFFQIYKLKPQKSMKIKRLYIDETLLFNQFFKQLNNPLASFLSKKCEFDVTYKTKEGLEHPVASLIELIFDGKDVQMMLDLNELFTKTVFKRLKPSKGAKVSLDMPYIYIDEKDQRTRLRPSWKKVNPKSLDLHKKDINGGFKDLLSKDIDTCYLVYPKHECFTKHIVLKDENDNQLKVIPYSFTFTNKKIA